MQNEGSHQYDHSGFHNESVPSWFEYFIGASKVTVLTILFHGFVIGIAMPEIAVPEKTLVYNDL